jgi:hypothetical protein
MTKALPFTENAIQRAVGGARKAGIKVGPVMVAPDGTIIVLDESLAPAIVPKQDPPPSKWAS